jgi:hypothetical protein
VGSQFSPTMGSRKDSNVLGVMKVIDESLTLCEWLS